MPSVTLTHCQVQELKDMLDACAIFTTPLAKRHNWDEFKQDAADRLSHARTMLSTAQTEVTPSEQLGEILEKIRCANMSNPDNQHKCGEQWLSTKEAINYWVKQAQSLQMQTWTGFRAYRQAQRASQRQE